MKKRVLRAICKNDNGCFWLTRYTWISCFTEDDIAWYVANISQKYGKIQKLWFTNEVVSNREWVDGSKAYDKLSDGSLIVFDGRTKK